MKAPFQSGKMGKGYTSQTQRKRGLAIL